MKKRATWQLPDGVSSGTWDYANSSTIAGDYDRYFANHAMFRLDQEITHRLFQPGKLVIDLGCGTGRALLPLLDRGLQGVAFDLSQGMLEEVRQKGAQTGHQVTCVRGNLVDMRCFADSSFDYAMCLFSTLGMVRGSGPRTRTMEHVSRIMKQNGLLVLQVHNYWAHLFDPGGPRRMIRSWWQARMRRDVEPGDRFYPYRGIPNMFLHSFTKKELRDLLAGHGFRIVEWHPLNATQTDRLPFPQLFEGVRASGWIVVGQKT